jgi:hypothetical protein
MLNIPPSESLKRVAQRLVWFKKPSDVLNDPYLFLAHVMTYGTIQDVITVQKVLGKEAFQEALENIPPGTMDIKSWHYWHLMVGHYPPPPMPVREFIFQKKNNMNE